MVIIIDAFNVIKAGFSSLEVDSSFIRGFLARVAAYAAFRKHEAVVVFDGGGSAHPTRVFEQGVLVIYAGYHQRADDEIMRLLRQYPPDNVVVVSSDREIVKYANLHGVVTVDADAFKKLMYNAEREKEQVAHRAKQRQGGLVKRAGHQSTAELDALMEKASERAMVKKEDNAGYDKALAPALHSLGEGGSSCDGGEGKSAGGKKLSKAERKLDRVIKKL